MTHAIRLIVTLCGLLGPHCASTAPRFFQSWTACATAGAAMLAHARRLGTGDVGFQCIAIGGRARR